MSGTPSPKLWKMYIDYLKKVNNSDIYSVNFRDKSIGWKRFSMRVQFDNNELCEPFYNNKYMNMFLGNICLRPSCHACHFKSLTRPSDITMGDCWGIENYKPELDDDMGASVVLINSEKGLRLFEKVSDRLIYKRAETDKARRHNRIQESQLQCILTVISSLMQCRRVQILIRWLSILSRHLQER